MQERILCYRKQLAYELKQESNDLPSTPNPYMDESPIHAYPERPPSESSRSPLHDLPQNKTPSLSGSSSSTNSDSLGGRKPNAGNEETAGQEEIVDQEETAGLNQENTNVLEQKRKRAKTDKTVVKTPVVPQRLQSETADNLWKLVLNADPTNDRYALKTYFVSLCKHVNLYFV